MGRSPMQAEPERTYRLAIVNSHPIQYFAPLYRRLAGEPDIDLTVYFCSRAGAEEYEDEGFGGQTIAWDVPLLEGYDHVVLNNLRGERAPTGFWSLVNPSVIWALRRERYDAVWIHGHAYVTYLLAEKGLSVDAANLALTLLFAAGIPGFALSGRLADSLPSVPYLLALLAAFVCGLVVLVRVEGAVGLLAVSVGIGLVVHGLFPALDVYVLGALPSADRASAYAVFSGLALSLESGGSGAVGLLTDAGYAFGTIFGGAAILLPGVVVALAALYLGGRFPEAGTGAVA
jgi:uncharacterized Tic20 family protein